MGPIAIAFAHPVELEPLEEEVDDDVIQERLVFEAVVVLRVDGDGVVAGRGKLAVLFVGLKMENLKCVSKIIVNSYLNNIVVVSTFCFTVL